MEANSIDHAPRTLRGFPPHVCAFHLAHGHPHTTSVPDGYSSVQEEKDQPRGEPDPVYAAGYAYASGYYD